VRSGLCLAWMQVWIDVFYIVCGMLFISLRLMLFLSRAGDCLGQPLLCRLGLHKWENYGKEVQIFWQEPALVYGLSTKSKVVFEKRRCLRCGVKLKRIFSTNPDGTLASVGWAPDTEGDQSNE
jgi:hypothetical protein